MEFYESSVSDKNYGGGVKKLFVVQMRCENIFTHLMEGMCHVVALTCDNKLMSRYFVRHSSTSLMDNHQPSTVPKKD